MRKFGPRPGEGPKGADDDEDDWEAEGGEDDREAERSANMLSFTSPAEAA